MMGAQICGVQLCARSCWSARYLLGDWLLVVRPPSSPLLPY